MTIPKRGAGRARATRPAVVADRHGQAAEMLADGATYGEIARALGYASRSAAKYAAQKGMAERAEQQTDSIRQSRERVAGVTERQLETWVPIANNPKHPLAVKGAEIVTKTVREYARVTGANAPTRVEVAATVAVTPPDRDAQIERVLINLHDYAARVGVLPAPDHAAALSTQQDSTNNDPKGSEK